MAASGGKNDSVVIRLRLDTTGAEADLARFQGKLGSVSQRVGVAAGVSGAPGGGGPLASLLGMSWSSMAAFGVGAAFGAPIARDVAGSVGSIGGSVGRMVSEWAGLGDMRRKLSASERSTQATVDAFGLAGIGVDPSGASGDQARALRKMYADLYGQMAQAETNVRAAIGADEVKDNLRILMEFLGSKFGEVIAILVGIRLLLAAKSLFGR